jgi:hypothetical protein
VSHCPGVILVTGKRQCANRLTLGVLPQSQPHMPMRVTSLQATTPVSPTPATSAAHFAFQSSRPNHSLPSYFPLLGSSALSSFSFFFPPKIFIEHSLSVRHYAGHWRQKDKHMGFMAQRRETLYNLSVPFSCPSSMTLSLPLSHATCRLRAQSVTTGLVPGPVLP